MKHPIGYTIKKTILYICLTLLAIICLTPFAMMMINATRTSDQIVKGFSLEMALNRLPKSMQDIVHLFYNV